MTDAEYMREALSLAEKGMGFVNPNPMVGAVIVKHGRIIGRGWHQKYGELHAERIAFANCKEDCSGAELYVTLEPCCHYGKTPPCTEAVIERKIKRVVIGSYDPNPLVSGKGIRILREHGIEVTEGVLKEECDRLNEIFMHYITTGTPFVTMKYAASMDGKIACYTGESKWITSEAARHQVQLERLRHSAVMTGIGTVLADDPMLTCRLENSTSPVRIICDTHLRIPVNCNIVRTSQEFPTIIVTCSDDNSKKSELCSKGCFIMNVNEADGHADLKHFIKSLSDYEYRKIDSILLEGGAELNWSALRAGIVNKVQSYFAPKILGGRNALSPVGGQGVPCPDDAFTLTDSKVKQLGNDFLIESRVKYVHGNY